MPEPIPTEYFNDVLRRAGATATPSPDMPRGVAPVQSLTLDHIRRAVDARSLSFPDDLLSQTWAALMAGQHVLLTGPPGTGKTSLATAIAEAATAAGVNAGVVQTTASSDWTPTDTVGAYRMNTEGQLSFYAGQMLGGIDADAWVIVDELNRADIDRAIGPLFSVLSGQTTMLQFQEETGAGLGRVVVLPEGTAPPPGTRPYVVGRSWRLLATMNTADLDLLFELSQAFLRRFAWIEVAPPPAAAHSTLLQEHATGRADLDALVQMLARIPENPLGPAITLDCARYIQQRSIAGPSTDARLIFNEGVAAFVRPQLGHLSAPARSRIEEFLRRDAPGGSHAPGPSDSATVMASTSPLSDSPADETGSVEDEGAERDDPPPS